MGQVYVELRLYDEVLQIRALWISAKAVVPPQEPFRESAFTDFRNKAPESTDRRDLPFAVTESVTGRGWKHPPRSDSGRPAVIESMSIDFLEQ